MKSAEYSPSRILEDLVLYRGLVGPWEGIGLARCGALSIGAPPRVACCSGRCSF